MIILNNNFKTIQLAAYFADYDSRDTMVHRFLLPKLLTTHTNTLLSKRQMNQRLGDLYGAYFKAANERIGNMSIISIKMTIANPNIVADKELLNKAVALFNDVIRDRNSFSEEIFAEEKRMILEYWQTLKDKKRAYANTKFSEHFFKGDTFGYKLQAIIRDIKKISIQDFYNYYKNVFLKNKINIIVNGHLNEKEIATIKQSLTYVSSAQVVFKPKIRRVKTVTEINEKTDMKQAIIKLGYNLPVYYNDKLFQATTILNIILGGYAESKLFKVIREEEGLCYDVSSRYDKYKGVLVISSGVDAKQKKYAISAIKKLVRNMIENGVLIDELKSAKAYYIQHLKGIMDNQFALTTRAYYNELLEDRQTIDDKFRDIENVSINDVLQVLQKLTLDTIYVLHGGYDDK